MRAFEAPSRPRNAGGAVLLPGDDSPPGVAGRGRCPQSRVVINRFSTGAPNAPSAARPADSSRPRQAWMIPVEPRLPSSQLTSTRPAPMAMAQTGSRRTGRYDTPLTQGASPGRTRCRRPGRAFLRCIISASVTLTALKLENVNKDRSLINSAPASILITSGSRWQGAQRI